MLLGTVVREKLAWRRGMQVGNSIAPKMQWGKCWGLPGLAQAPSHLPGTAGLKWQPTEVPPPALPPAWLLHQLRMLSSSQPEPGVSLLWEGEHKQPGVAQGKHKLAAPSYVMATKHLWMANSLQHNVLHQTQCPSAQLWQECCMRTTCPRVAE